MKTNKWTAEPWAMTEDGCAITAHDGGTLIVETAVASWQNLDAATAGNNAVAKRMVPEALANAARIVSCVNALAGIDDPERAVPKLVEALTGLLTWVESEYPNCPRTEDAWGHRVIERAASILEKIKESA